MGHSFPHFGIGLIRAGRPCTKTVDIAVIHAEGGGDQYGIMYFPVGGALLAGSSYIRFSDIFSVSLNLVSDMQQRPHFIRYIGVWQTGFDLVDQTQPAFVMCGRRSGM